MWHPSPLFSFPSLLFFSPGIFYSLHISSLRLSLQHVDQPIPREASAVCRAVAFAAVIFLLPPLIPWPSFPLRLSGPHPAFLLPPYLAMRLSTAVLCASCACGSTTLFPGRDMGHMAGLGTPCLGFYLSVIIFRSSSHKATCVQQMCTCDGCRLSRGTQVSWLWMSWEEGESSEHPLPEHLGAAQGSKGLSNSSLSMELL